MPGLSSGKEEPDFTFYDIYNVAVYSMAAWVITDVLPVDVLSASPLAGEDLLLCRPVRGF